MTEFWAFIKCVPELLALYKVLAKICKEAMVQRKVSDELKNIHEAINARDPEALNRVFIL